MPAGPGEQLLQNWPVSGGQLRAVVHDVELVGGCDLGERAQPTTRRSAGHAGEAVQELDGRVLQPRVDVGPVAAAVQVDQVLGLTTDDVPQRLPLIDPEQLDPKPSVPYTA